MEAAPRVNARLLPQFMGRTVTVIGQVIQGSNPVLRCGDGKDISIQLPPGEFLEGSYTQVIGKVVSESTVSAMRITPVSADFNMENYEALVELSNGAHKDLFM